MPKFDVVVGNPPYNAKKVGGGVGSGNAIWHLFVELSFKILKDNGYLCFIHPCDWRLGLASKKKQKAQSLLLNNQIIYAKLFVTPFKGIGQVVDWYVVQKTPKYESSKIQFKNGLFDVNMNETDCLLNFGGPLVNSIIDKVLNTTNNGLFVRKSFGGLIKLDESKPKGQYKFAHGSRYINDDWVFFEYPHIHQFKPKVIMSAVRQFRPIYDKGEIGISDHIHYILVKNRNEGNFFISILNSKLMIFLQKLYSSDIFHDDSDTPNRWNNPAPLKKIKMDDKILKTDQDVFEYFDLTQEEIDYIESQVK